MAISRTFDYTARNFAEIRQQLIEYVNTYYPEIAPSFASDNGIGNLLLELNAGVGDILSHNTDRVFQETQLENAQESKSIIQHAKTMGLNVGGKRASITLAEFKITVPTLGDSFDSSYCGVLKAGSQIIGAGQSFELIEDLDFSSPISPSGNKNRQIIPNMDSSERVRSYDIVKLHPVYNGQTKVFSYTNRTSESALQIVLPDVNVIDVVSVIVKNGVVDTTPTNNEFNDEALTYYEVEYLAQPHVFIENKSISDPTNVKAGKIKEVTKKFIKEYTDSGFCKLTFGLGNGDMDIFNEVLTNNGFNGLTSYLINTSLGEKIPINSTVFVKYRIGGGSQSNIASGVLSNLGSTNFIVNGVRSDENQKVERSLKVTNPIAAFGGADSLSIEQIRYLIKYNFASQNRCVTLNDYLVKTYLMPGKFGSPFKVNVIKVDNKVVILIIGRTSDGTLDNTSTTLLKENIAEWISQFRMINDYVEIRDGRIYNIGYSITVYVDDRGSTIDVVNQIVLQTKNFHDVNKIQMGDDIYLGNLIESINNVPNVINVLDIKAYNKVGGAYSVNEVKMPYVDELTKEIEIKDYTLHNTTDGIFEIKFPTRDIKVSIKRKNNFNNSN